MALRIFFFFFVIFSLHPQNGITGLQFLKEEPRFEFIVFRCMHGVRSFLNCGPFLRADSHMMDKERLDYTRILLATSSLEVVNAIDKILVDGFYWKLKLWRSQVFL